jgi:hypothetical protein
MSDIRRFFFRQVATGSLIKCVRVNAKNYYIQSPYNGTLNILFDVWYIYRAFQNVLHDYKYL